MSSGNAVAATSGDSHNTLKTPNVRLPIGHDAEDTSTGAATVFHVWVPTKAGGVLELKLTGTGEMELFTDTGEVTDSVATSKTGSLKYTVPRGSYGKHSLVVKGPSPRKVACTFTQTALARDGTSDSDPLLLPWNFFLWPTVKAPDGIVNPYIQQMEAALTKYAKAYGHDAAAAVTWENKNHFRDKGASWSGHCHLMARASVLFEQPVAAKVKDPSGTEVSFTEDELEFLAGEWFGRWGQSTLLFRTDAGHRPWPRTGDNSDVTTQSLTLNALYWSQCLKPSQAQLRNTVELSKILKEIILSYDSSEEVKKKAQKMADAAASSPEIMNGVRDAFGTLGASFYVTLVSKMFHEKNALVSDLRGAAGGNPPTEVWNHAIFRFAATFKEILPQDKENDANQNYMQVTLDLYANDDYPHAPSPGLPAKVDDAGKVLFDATGILNRRSWHLLRLAFSNGDVSRTSPRNQWLSCKNGPQGDELYMPAYAVCIEPAGATVANSTHNTETEPHAVGNALLDLDIVGGAKAALKRRKRFQK
jgi:hypothetical protein